MNCCHTFRFQLVTPLAIGFLLVSSLAADDGPLFENGIQTLLAGKCGRCHSERVQKGGLSLATMADLRRGGESGEPAVGDSIDESLLWTMVESESMPPEGAPPLSAEERALLHRWLSAGAPSAEPSTPLESKLTQHDVIPIVLLRCATCHGARLQRGGVDMRSVASMKQSGDRGSVLIPGDPDQSLMIQRIESEACPPRDQLLKYFVRRPGQAEVQTLRNWIAAGAPEVDVTPDVATTEPDPLVTEEDRSHWAFRS
ncbi:MAG: hypothetical protein KDA85_21925, partial [Planctomycetaceae bacterium]|nr:hypothetical protein [Planctomycetaceae bacterium]